MRDRPFLDFDGTSQFCDALSLMAIAFCFRARTGCSNLKRRRRCRSRPNRRERFVRCRRSVPPLSDERRRRRQRPMQASCSRSRGDGNSSSPEENGSPAAAAPSALQPPSPPDAGPPPCTFAPDFPAPAVRGLGHPETGGQRLRRRGWARRHAACARRSPAPRTRSRFSPQQRLRR